MDAPKASGTHGEASELVAPVSVESSKPRGILGTFPALGVHDFRLLLLGTTLSNAAQCIQQVTLGWLVYDLTGSGTAIGSINLVRSVATVGLAPLAGTLIDRFPRRPLMLACQAWLFIIALILGLVLLAGYREVWYLFVFGFLGGAAQTLDMPLRQTATFDVVPRAVAPNAVALIQTGWSLMRSIGPALGGVLILFFGPAGNFLVQAGAHALIAANIVRIQFPARPANTRPPVNAFKNMGAGISYILQQPTTRTFVMMGWVLPLFIIPIFSALPPIYAKDVFNGGPEVLGFLMSAVGLGGIVGGVFTASLGQFERRGLIQLISLLGVSVALMGFAFSPSLFVALPLLAVAGAFEMVYLTTNQTLLQLSISDEMRGRVTSILSLNMAIVPLGSFIAGVGSDLIGPRAVTFVLSTIGATIAIGVFLGSSTVRDYRLSHAMAQPRTKE